MPTASDLIPRLLAWYDRHRRALPWRAAPGVRPDPYQVLLSEIMLQQTTSATAGPRFAAFLERFPTLEALASAPLEDVLHAWQGLGYYRRARGLHACARALIARHDGVVPSDEAALRALPGIGPYTARAIRAIAYDAPTLPVDGNVLRVIARLHAVEAPLPAATKELESLATGLTPRARAGDAAQALMDLGATVCRPRHPSCMLCPWQHACAARRRGIAAELPRRVAKPERPTKRALAFLLSRPDGAILFRKRPPNGLLGGLHELPSSPWCTGALDADAALRYAPLAAGWQLHDEVVRHGFTHFVLELTIAEARTQSPPDGLWCAPDQLHRLALPTLMKRVLQRTGALVPAKGSGEAAPAFE